MSVCDRLPAELLAVMCETIDQSNRLGLEMGFYVDEKTMTTGSLRIGTAHNLPAEVPPAGSALFFHTHPTNPWAAGAPSHVYISTADLLAFAVSDIPSFCIGGYNWWTYDVPSPAVSCYERDSDFGEVAGDAKELDSRIEKYTEQHRAYTSRGWGSVEASEIDRLRRERESIVSSRTLLFTRALSGLTRNKYVKRCSLPCELRDRGGSQ